MFPATSGTNSANEYCVFTPGVVEVRLTVLPVKPWHRTFESLRSRRFLMVDSYDHLAVDWENALRPARYKPKLNHKVPKSLRNERTASHERV